MESNMIFVPMILAVIGLIFTAIKASWVKKQNPGNEKMQSISKAIKEGANKQEAADIKAKLEAAGAKVELK